MNNEKLSIPSQVFKWFEKMKANYERNIATVLDRFERHTNAQQQRVDTLHAGTLKSLSQSHQALVASQQQQIEQLQQEVHFYQAQMSEQQQIIDRLNQRYDTVMVKILSNTQDEFEEKDFAGDLPVSNHFLAAQHKDSVSKSTDIDGQFDKATEHPASVITDADKYFNQAMQHREQKQFVQAIACFTEAAKLNHGKAMGALGRAHFLAEGVEQDPVMGLRWLIKAAENGFPQAQSKVNFYKENEPELYLLATSV